MQGREFHARFRGRGDWAGNARPYAVIAIPNSSKAIQLARAVAELFNRNAGLLQHAQQQIVERRVSRIYDVAIALGLSRAAARQDDRQVVMRMQDRKSVG